jgi:enamine deaminase RidA (YjgF/YER057c/UK114 family)
MPINYGLLADIPDLQIPSAAFKPYILHQSIVYISGQLPIAGGKPALVGRVPDQISVDKAKEAAELCMRNVLSCLKHACGGDFGKIERCIRLGGVVYADRDFTDAPGIINVASQMATAAFGDQGEHCRIAIGVASLPLGCPVEIEAAFAIRA